MTEKTSHNGSNGNREDYGYVPAKRGYKPGTSPATGGHKPEKSELKPVNPPKSK